MMLRYSHTLLTVLVIISFSFYFFIRTFNYPLHFRLTSSERTNQQLTSLLPLKRILFWTTYWDFPDFEFGYGTEPFIKAGCKVTNCWTTSDRSFLDSSDAVLFHARDYNKSDLPGRRLSHQRFIFLNHEGIPASSYEGKLDYDVFRFNVPHYFNWTMTQRRDSDIITHHGSFLPLSSTPISYPIKLTQPFPSIGFLSKDYNKGRRNRKLMVWFVSNCRTNSKREDYMKELLKWIPVDIYGTCGFGKVNLTCMPGIYVTEREDCFKRIIPEYKFYFSAENNFCPDYVSERLYQPFRLGAVPVVFGGADYSALVPCSSYIDVADFRSPKQLADYLLMLDDNDALYSKYFDWKKDYKVIEHHPKNGLCELCEKLNDPKVPSKSYANLSKWWFDDAPCYYGPMPFIQNKSADTTILTNHR